MMGLDMPKTCRGCWNILRIRCASSWFFNTQLYGDKQLAKHKTNYVDCSLQCLYSSHVTPLRNHHIDSRP